MARIQDLSAALAQPARPSQEKRLSEAERGEEGQVAGGLASTQSFSQQLAASQGRKSAAAGEELPENSKTGEGSWLSWLAGALGAQLSGKVPVGALGGSADRPSPAGLPVDPAPPRKDAESILLDSFGSGTGPGPTVAGETSGQMEAVDQALTAGVGPECGTAASSAPIAAAEVEKPDTPVTAETSSSLPLAALIYAAPRLEIASHQTAPLVRQAAMPDGGESLTSALRPVATPSGVTLSAGTLAPAMVGISGTAADPAHVLEQVLDQLLGREAEAGGQERLTLKLDPPELGRVEVRLEVVGGRLEVTLRAETHEAESALRSRSHELVEGLVARGGRWTDIQVRLERQETGGRQGQRQEGRQEGRSGEERSDQRSAQERRRRGQ
jgi:flagellar hook-length control protein FliK